MLCNERKADLKNSELRLKGNEKMSLERYETIDGMKFPVFKDLKGNRVKRTPYSHPYSYDEHVIWKNECDTDNSHVVYSDRLTQWDYEKYNRCSREVFGNEGQMFYNREPKNVEKFLCLYLEQEIKLTAIMQGCNLSNGFPYWIFFYEESK